MAHRIALGSAWTGPGQGRDRLNTLLNEMGLVTSAPFKKPATRKKPVKKVKSAKLATYDITDIEQWHPGTGWVELEKTMKGLVKDLNKGLKTKLKKWGSKTLADMKAITPVDSGNLVGSLGYIGNTKGAKVYGQVKTEGKTGRMTLTVGIREGDLLPPPRYLPSTKHKGRTVTIPDYNYAPFANEAYLKKYDDGFIGEWMRIAKKNAEEIFK